MFLPDVLVLLCQGFTAFHIGTFLLSCVEKRKDSPTITNEEESHRPVSQLPRSCSSSSTTLISGSSSTTQESTPRTLPLAIPYPLSDMKGNSTPSLNQLGEYVTTAGYHDQLVPLNDMEPDLFSDNDACVTSTPLKPMPIPFLKLHTTNSRDKDNTAPAPLDNDDVPKLKYPKPTFCPFFSSAHITNIDRTKELWKRRLDIAKTRNLRMTKARAAELAHKSSFIRRMDFIEGIRWELPSELDQCLFLMHLQAAEEEKEKGAYRGGLRDDDDSSGDEQEDDRHPDERGGYTHGGGPTRYNRDIEIEDEGYVSQDDGNCYRHGSVHYDHDHGRELEDAELVSYDEVYYRHQDLAGDLEDVALRLDALHKKGQALLCRPTFQ